MKIELCGKDRELLEQIARSLERVMDAMCVGDDYDDSRARLDFQIVNWKTSKASQKSEDELRAPL